MASHFAKDKQELIAQAQNNFFKVVTVSARFVRNPSYVLMKINTLSDVVF